MMELRPALKKAGFILQNQRTLAGPASEKGMREGDSAPPPAGWIICRAWSALWQGGPKGPFKCVFIIRFPGALDAMAKLRVPWV